MPFNIGAPELIILLVIALLVLGPGKLPEVGSALGKSIREFRKASTEIQESLKVETTPGPQTTSSAAPAPAPQSAPAPQPNQLSAPATPNTLAEPATPIETPVEARRS